MRKFKKGKNLGKTLTDLIKYKYSSEYVCEYFNNLPQTDRDKFIQQGYFNYLEYIIPLNPALYGRSAIKEAEQPIFFQKIKNLLLK